LVNPASLMKKDEIEALINRLLAEIEEEDVGISLFSTFYQNEAELAFFTKEDRKQVAALLQKLSKDSKHHKGILEKIIGRLEAKLHER